jgi:DNA-binding LacI/PurR family transcriptional regulator
LTLKTALARQHAFMQAMEEIGLAVDPQHLVEGNHTMEGGIQAMQKLFGLAQIPTAVICSNDMTALGVMRESYAQGVHVPKELSVVGFDDIRLAQFVIPPLTTVKMSQTEIARLAFNALLAEVRRKTPSPTGSEYMLRTSLVLRDSTALAPKTARRRKPKAAESGGE